MKLKNYSGQYRRALRFAQWVQNGATNCPPDMYTERELWKKLLDVGGVAAVAGALCAMPIEYGRGG